MTDETRPTEGRTPSDYPESQGRPEFLPADHPAESPGGRAEPPASFGGTSWGDPSGRAAEPAGPPPYQPSYAPYGGSPDASGEQRGGSGPAYAPAFAAPGTGQDHGTRQYDSPAFGRPDGGPASGDDTFGDGPTGDRPLADTVSGPSFGGPASTAPPYAGPPFGTPSSSGTSFGGPSSGGASYGGPSSGEPSFGGPSSGGTSYGSPPPDGEPSFGGSPSGGASYGGPSFGGPSSGGASFGGPSFGGPSFGTPPPPPPGQALGMGAGWAPPPPVHGGPAGDRRRGPGTGGLIALALAIALVASGLGSVGTYLLTRPSGSAVTDPSYSLGPVPTGAASRDPGSIAGVAARVLPSVVSLEVGNGSNTEGASGSGFLIKNGYVVTNNHVVAMAANGGEIQIQFNNRKTTSARIVGRDPGSDLAVVKPEETFGTPEITLGNSDQVVVGDPVIAIGSPLGLTGTVTTGIVSSLNRPVIAGDETGAGTEETAYISAIQTDAAINPGNSGGPLVNSRGEVVGVNSAIATLSRSINGQSGSIGLGFAIPVNQTRRVAEELISTGRAKRPKIGIVLEKDYRGQGVKIATANVSGQQPVTPGGPADKAGLRAGDVILEMDGLALQDGNELIALIRSKTPGSKITIKYQRAGQERTATLTVVAEDGPSPTPS
ncbi:Serine protease Do-like HtrA [Nonomuraea coxensis DSM 45129]|uniref:Serine protease Do-like HtrA n=1 Tax=Nonomuraea coxensis DSM 45129 TaxID=1122611 RepID=A0ABX8UAP6_9ACTN|nr:trypsin-like peptidase domain-containing protein [Nonomuraea coxensis]QYC44856.1 Serine protease Do-like HtrA [Nonomuraea coxensis DSM 45129]